MLRVVFYLLSPVVFFLAVTRCTPRQGAALIVLWITLRALEPLWKATPAQRWDVLKLPLVGIAFAILAGVINSPTLLLLIPAATQFSFAFLFARSLREEQPLVERFARLQVPELPPDEVVYCRTVTIVWAVYLALLGAVAFVLALVATPTTWALFNGIGLYALVAALFAIEYSPRPTVATRSSFSRRAAPPSTRPTNAPGSPEFAPPLTKRARCPASIRTRRWSSRAAASRATR